MVTIWNVRYAEFLSERYQALINEGWEPFAGTERWDGSNLWRTIWFRRIEPYADVSEAEPSGYILEGVRDGDQHSAGERGGD